MSVTSFASYTSTATRDSEASRDDVPGVEPTEVGDEIGEAPVDDVLSYTSGSTINTLLIAEDDVTLAEEQLPTIKEDAVDTAVVQQETSQEPSEQPQPAEQPETTEPQEPSSEQKPEGGEELSKATGESQGVEGEGEGEDAPEAEVEVVPEVEIDNTVTTLDTEFQLMEDDELVPEDEVTKYILVEETVMDDMGKQVKVKQKVPIIRETRQYERISVLGEGDEGKTHKFLETITRVIKKSAVNEEGELEEQDTELTEVIEHEERPDEAVTVYTKRVNEKGEVELVVVPIDEPIVAVKPTKPTEREDRRRKSEMTRMPIKKQVLKIVKEKEPLPCQPGKVHEVLKTTIEEIEVLEEEEDEGEMEELDDEDLTEEEQIQVHEKMLKKREAKIAKQKENLRTVLVRLALAEKKRALYMQLISISSEVKEDILNPPDPDKPTFKVPKKVKTEDKFRRMYQQKLMEYRELRSAILVRLATEKRRKEEVKQNYDVIALEVAQLRKQLEDKLTGAISKLLPKNDPVFKNQSPQGMVKRVLELIERLDDETKELMYKKKQMYLAKQAYDEITENEQGLSYRYALQSKELKQIVGKNSRRNEKLESLKTTMQKESLAVTHINQKCEAILKTTDEKNSRLQSLNQSLIKARQDRKDVHQARRKVESELRQENARIKLKNHPSLLKEHQLIQDLLKSKQMEFHQLKKHCLSSLKELAKTTAVDNLPSITPRYQ